MATGWQPTTPASIPTRAAEPTASAGAGARLLYHLLWQARLVTRRQRTWSGLERRLERRLLSRPDERPGVRPVPRLRVTDPEFRLDARRHRSPVVLEGLLERSSVVRDWSLDYLSEHHGSTRVKVVEPGAGGVRRARFVELSRYVRDVRAGAQQYVMGSASFFESNGELLEGFELPRLQRMIGRRIIRLETFIGTAGSGSSFHCAGIGNLFCQVHGRKRWRLVPPSWSPWMYPEFGKNPYAVHVTSPIRLDRYDEQRETYPLFARVPLYEARLEPGDVLFNPAWWWHEVENLDETIGVPMRVVTTPRTNPSFTVMAAASFLTSKEFGQVFVPLFRKVTGLEPKKERPDQELFLTDESPVLDAAIQDFYDRAR